MGFFKKFPRSGHILDSGQITLGHGTNLLHRRFILVPGVIRRVGRIRFRQVTETTHVRDFTVTARRPHRFVHAGLLHNLRRRESLLPVFGCDIIEKSTHLQRIGHLSELGISSLKMLQTILLCNRLDSRAGIVLAGIIVRIGILNRHAGLSQSQ